MIYTTCQLKRILMDNDKLSEEIINALASPFADALDGIGVTKQFLAKRLKKEINAKETKLQKLKGAVSTDDLPKTRKGNVKPGYRIVAASEDNETLIEIDYLNWTISQKARMDANKLRGDYPAEKHELSTNQPIIVEVVSFSESDCRKTNS